MTNTSFHGNVIASFKHLNKADSFYKMLREMSYTEQEISTFMSESTKQQFEKADLDQSVTVAEGATTGSLVGSALGAIAGAILGLGSNAIIPGLGLVVTGPLLGALTVAGAGSAAGTVIGGLTSLGLNNDYGKKFHDDIEQGYVVVSVDPRHGDIEKIIEHAKHNDAINIYSPKD